MKQIRGGRIDTLNEVERNWGRGFQLAAVQGRGGWVVAAGTPDF